MQSVFLQDFVIDARSIWISIAFQLPWNVGNDATREVEDEEEEEKCELNAERGMFFKADHIPSSAPYQLLSDSDKKRIYSRNNVGQWRKQICNGSIYAQEQA